MTNEDTQEPNVPPSEPPPSEPPPSEPPLSAPDFFISTSPEMDALERAAADGKHGRHYQNDQYGETRTHQVPKGSHFVRLALSDGERMAGATSVLLENLTESQDADSALAFLYIASLLAPPPTAGAVAPVRGKISFDDVIAKIGWDPRSTEERREMHQRILTFIQFGERAQVVGVRRGKYRDKHTGEEITTQINASLWRILAREQPVQGSLYPEMEIPVSVELAISSEWEKLLTSPQTAQYLPMGEILGAIPGNKSSGAWARIIGLALASFWRRLPRESLDGSIKPTRRELLDRYTPKTGSVDSVLRSNNPQEAISHWCGALRLLVKADFIEDWGETKVTTKEMRAALPLRFWADQWLDEKVAIRPAPLLKESIGHRAAALPAKSPKKRGRPRKTVT